MSSKILMPALSPTMTDGIINQWLVKVGDTVKAGDIIAEIETDKATMEVEAVDEGKITHILEDTANKQIPVNSVIAIIDGDESESIENKKTIENTSEDKKDEEIEIKFKLDLQPVYECKKLKLDDTKKEIEMKTAEFTSKKAIFEEVCKMDPVTDDLKFGKEIKSFKHDECVCRNSMSVVIRI